MKEEEFELLKLISDKIKVKNMWLKVYDEETKREGYISMNEILEGFLNDLKEKEK